MPQKLGCEWVRWAAWRGARAGAGRQESLSGVLGFGLRRVSGRSRSAGAHGGDNGGQTQGVRPSDWRAHLAAVMPQDLRAYAVEGVGAQGCRTLAKALLVAGGTWLACLGAG